MNVEIAKTVLEVKNLWKDLNLESISRIKEAVSGLAKDPGLKEGLQMETAGRPKGIELHRDEAGFVLLAYRESEGSYRPPHDHGHAWVLYVVVSGEVEMGAYQKILKPDGRFHPLLKGRELLKAGGARIYFPGEIHDTRCLSEEAVILRLTSSDLKEEERLGRMSRFDS